MPSVLIPIVVKLPDEIYNQFVAEPTCTGVDLLTVSPTPNMPDPLYPQAHNVPVDLIANVDARSGFIVTETQLNLAKKLGIEEKDFITELAKENLKEHKAQKYEV